MLRKISTDKAPAAIGPYSQGIIVNSMLFASGQIPINPDTGEIEGRDISAFNEVYAKYFTEKPARSCVAVKTLPKNVLCEVEVIAEV